MTFTVRYFFPDSSVNNFWVAARVKNTRVIGHVSQVWKTNTQYVKLGESCYSLSIFCIMNLQELLEKKIGADLTLLIKLKYQNKQNKIKVISKYICRWNLRLDILRIFSEFKLAWGVLVMWNFFNLAFLL